MPEPARAAVFRVARVVPMELPMWYESQASGLVWTQCHEETHGKFPSRRADSGSHQRKDEDSNPIEGNAPNSASSERSVSPSTVGQTVRSTFMDPVIAAGLNKPPPITEAFKGFQ